MSLMETTKQQLLQIQLHQGPNGIENTKPFQKLLRLLRKNHSSCPRVLDLSGVELAVVTMQTLCEALTKCSIVQALNLSACEIDDDGAVHLAKLLSDPTKVIFEVDVSFNQLTDRGVNAIFASVKENPSVVVIQLLANDCTSTCENDFQNYMTRRRLASSSSISSSSSTSSSTSASTNPRTQVPNVQKEQESLFEEFEPDEETKRWLFISEGFFKGLNNLLYFRNTNRCTRKDLYKHFSELIITAMRECQTTPFASWEDIFHGFFIATNEMIPTSTIESYERLTREFINEVNLRISKEEGNEDQMTPWSSSSSSNPNALHSSFSSPTLPTTSRATLGMGVGIAGIPSVNTTLSSSPPEKEVSSLLCAPLLGFSNTNTRLQRLRRLHSHTQELLQFLLIHKVDAVNSLMGVVPAPTIVGRHFAELQQACEDFERQHSKHLMKRRQTFSTRYNQADIPMGGDSQTGSEIQENRKGLGLDEGESGGDQTTVSSTSSLSTSPRSLSTSPLSISPREEDSSGDSNSNTNSSSSPTVIHQVPSPPLARRATARTTTVPSTAPPTAAQALQQSISLLSSKISKEEFERQIVDWSRCKEEDALAILRQIQDLAAQIQGAQPKIEAGDLVVVRNGSVLVYGRVTRVISPGSLMIRTSLNEAGSTYSKSDTTAFPQSLLPLLQSFSSAKRLVENPVESFYRDMVSRVKDAILNHLALKGIDVAVLERALQKQVVLADELMVSKMITQLQRVLEEGLDPVVGKLEVYLALGLHELRDSVSFNPLLRDAMKSFSEFNVKVIVSKRVQDHHSKLGEALDGLRAEKSALMDGSKKNQLSQWWLRAIQEKVHSFLTDQKYDLNAVPEDYINEPPRSVWKVQRNLEIVRRWLRASNEEDARTVKQLIKSIGNQVNPRLDRFILNSEFLVLDYLKNVDPKAPRSPYIIAGGDRYVEARLEEVKALIQQSLDKFSSPLVAKQLKTILQDCEYIVEMKRLDIEPERVQNEKGRSNNRSGITRAVPVTELVMGCLARLENELNTVVEIWYTNRKSTTARILKEKRLYNFFGENANVITRDNPNGTANNSAGSTLSPGNSSLGSSLGSFGSPEGVPEGMGRGTNIQQGTKKFYNDPTSLDSSPSSTSSSQSGSPNSGGAQVSPPLGSQPKSSPRDETGYKKDKLSQFFGVDLASHPPIQPSAPMSHRRRTRGSPRDYNSSSSSEERSERELDHSSRRERRDTYQPSPRKKKEKLAQFFGVEPVIAPLEQDMRKDKLANFFGTEPGTLQTSPPSSLSPTSPISPATSSPPASSAASSSLPSMGSSRNRLTSSGGTSTSVPNDTMSTTMIPPPQGERKKKLTQLISELQAASRTGNTPPGSRQSSRRPSVTEEITYSLSPSSSQESLSSHLPPRSSTTTPTLPPFSMDSASASASPSASTSPEVFRSHPDISSVALSFSPSDSEYRLPLALTASIPLTAILGMGRDSLEETLKSTPLTSPSTSSSSTSPSSPVSPVPVPSTTSTTSSTTSSALSTFSSSSTFSPASCTTPTGTRKTLGGHRESQVVASSLRSLVGAFSSSGSSLSQQATSSTSPPSTVPTLYSSSSSPCLSSTTSPLSSPHPSSSLNSPSSSSSSSTSSSSTMSTMTPLEKKEKLAAFFGVDPTAVKSGGSGTLGEKDKKRAKSKRKDT